MFPRTEGQAVLGMVERTLDIQKGVNYLQQIEGLGRLRRGKLDMQEIWTHSDLEGRYQSPTRKKAQIQETQVIQSVEFSTDENYGKEIRSNE